MLLIFAASAHAEAAITNGLDIVDGVILLAVESASETLDDDERAFNQMRARG